MYHFRHVPIAGFLKFDGLMNKCSEEPQPPLQTLRKVIPDIIAENGGATAASKPIEQDGEKFGAGSTKMSEHAKLNFQVAKDFLPAQTRNR